MKTWKRYIPTEERLRNPAYVENKTSKAREALRYNTAMLMQPQYDKAFPSPRKRSSSRSKVKTRQNRKASIKDWKTVHKNAVSRSNASYYERNKERIKANRRKRYAKTGK